MAKRPISSPERPAAKSATASRDDPALFAADRAVPIVIDADAAGQRLDNFLLRHAKGVPKSHVYRIVRGGEVRVNGRRCDAARRLEVGDRVRLPPLRIAAKADEASAAASKREKPVAFAIVHEDDDLLAVDKPAGVAVHGGSGLAFGVIEQLRAQRPDARFLELVHRLDRETSGLLLVAKRRSALVRLHAEWRDGEVEKRYLACVAGAWPEARRRVRAPLVRGTGPDGERRVRVARTDDADAMSASTDVRRVEVFDGPSGRFALVDVALETGRTHQIRVHLAHIGRPIVGDERYGDFELNRRVARGRGRPAIRRMFLHAAALAFAHPATGETLRLAAPLPRACAAFLDALRAESMMEPNGAPERDPDAAG